MLAFVAHANVEKMACFDAAQSMLLHEYDAGIFQAVLTQSLMRCGRDAIAAEKQGHK
jgi:hypothetical protein